MSQVFLISQIKCQIFATFTKNQKKMVQWPERCGQKSLRPFKSSIIDKQLEFLVMTVAIISWNYNFNCNDFVAVSVTTRQGI
jgi:hypothetical protein